MKREIRQVNYSYEHGDESLPNLKKLVSEISKPEKARSQRIKNTLYLGIPMDKYDEINPDKTIGCGKAFSGGVLLG